MYSPAPTLASFAFFSKSSLCGVEVLASTISISAAAKIKIV
jgi:hypothetical protein